MARTSPVQDPTRRSRYRVLRLSSRAALAAAVAWGVVQPLGGALESYSYYAPLGAVVAMSTTVMGSVRGSLRAVVAIALGAGIGLVSMALPSPEVVELMLAVGLGVAVGSWRWLGGRGNWVAVTALFVLLVGQRDPWHYAVAYLALTAVGAVVGIAVNLLVPTVPTVPTAPTAPRSQSGSEVTGPRRARAPHARSHAGR